MGWTREPARIARDRLRPCLESLESRQLLSTLNAHPTDSSASVTNGDGSTNFDQIIGASAARSTDPVTGAGMSVAVIDTGVNYLNPALGGGIGLGHKVIAGVDFTGSPRGVLPTWQHGTGVAGLIASDTPGYKGVAPGVDIVALRVFGDNNQGSFANIEKALDWVVQHHSDYNITAVNLSTSDGGNYLANDFAQDGGVGQSITRTIKQLDTLNIPLVVAAGNSFNGKAQGQGFPAIVSDAISVTATDASDELASNAQRLGPARGHGSATTIAAPGVGITGPADGSSFTSQDGTSFAAPQVTGGIILLQQMYENAYHKLPTVAQLEGWLQKGSVPVHDKVTQVKIGRLSVVNSAGIEALEIAADPTANLGSNNDLMKAAVVSTPAVVAPPPQTAPAPTSPAPPPPAPTPPAPTPPAPTPPVQSSPAEPQSEVFYNGTSIGSYPTTRLAARYANLFTYLKGQVGGIQIYGAKGSAPYLGVSKPTGSAVAPPTIPKGPVVHRKGESNGMVHAMVLQTPKVGDHKPGVIARSSSGPRRVFRPNV